MSAFNHLNTDLAESDLIYTESIMCRGMENLKGKEILILGGGDGALLNELRKEDPKHVTMIEVIFLCKYSFVFI